MMGMSAKTKMVTRVGRRNPRVTHDGKRELITDLETIRASGTCLPPFLIFKAKAGHCMGWYESLDDPDVLLAYSPKGWTDETLGFEFITRHFNRFAPPSAPGRKRLIILDGHSSHINWNFCMYCLDNEIILLCLPAHSTHLLQPLDVAVFGPLQHFYGLAVDDFSRQQGGGIHKGVFWPLLRKAREKAITSDNIKSAFRSTGLIPYYLKIVLDRLQFSTATSHTPLRRFSQTLGLQTPAKSTDFRRETNKVLQSVGKVTHEELKKMISRLGEIGAGIQAALEISEEGRRQDRQKATNVTQKGDKRRMTSTRVIDGKEAMALYNIRQKSDKIKKEIKKEKQDRKTTLHRSKSSFQPQKASAHPSTPAHQVHRR